MALENLNSIFNDLPDFPNESVHRGDNSSLNDINLFPIVSPDNLTRQLTRIPKSSLVEPNRIDINRPLNGSSWEKLYTSDHNPLTIDSPSPRSGNTIQPYLYGGEVNRDNLKIRGGGDSRKASIFSPSRDDFLGIGGGEPYVVSNIPTTEGLSGGRILNQGGRSIPLIRAVTDTLRLTKYLSSPAGLAFIAKQNALGLAGSQAEWAIPSNDGSPSESTIISPSRFASLYSPLSTLGSSLARVVGSGNQGGVPSLPTLLRRDFPLPTDNSFDIPSLPTGELFQTPTANFSQFTDYESVVNDYSIHPSFGGYMQFSTDTNSPLVDTRRGGSLVADGSRYRNKSAVVKSGDRLTLAKIIKGDNLKVDVASTEAGDEQLNFNVESYKNGMPFYFKDLRDNGYIFFRAYIDGLTESVSPNWNPTNYIGRSEPVYVYQSAEREINFNLKLFAHTPDEFSMIYTKINRLTSLAYPEYKKDDQSRLRMKPPLTKMRIGEMFGRENNELTGFIKSLSYNIPEESPYETEEGKRAPRHIMVTISYQVIHGDVPQFKQIAESGNLETEESENDYSFYGYVGDSNG